MNAINVMAEDRMMMPQGSAGLIRYFDSTEESIKLKPNHVLGISLAIIVAELAVKFLL